MSLAIVVMHTIDVIWNCAIPKMSFAIVAYKKLPFAIVAYKQLSFSIVAYKSYCSIYAILPLFLYSQTFLPYPYF